MNALHYLPFLTLFLAVPAVPLLLIREGKFRRYSLLFITGIIGIIGIIAAKSLFFPEYSEIFSVPLPAGLCLAFTMDRLSSVFLLLLSVVSASATLYTFRYIEPGEESPERKNILIMLISLFIISMTGVISSANLLAFLFCWEVMAVSSFFLVLYEFEWPDVAKAGLFYFTLTQLSTVFLFTGFILLYMQTGSLNIGEIRISGIMGAITSAMLFLGFGIKAGIVPFHKWLPYAHPAAPSPVSALMSGLMISIAIYGFCRFFITILPPDLLWGMILFICGLASAVLGIIYALKEHDIKALLAYSSIENIGIIVTGLGLSIIFRSYGYEMLGEMAYIGALFHTMSHGCAKTLLFLTAGSVIHESGTRDINHLGGLIHTMPKTGAFFLAASMSIIALPPFSGFVGEFLIIQSVFLSFFTVDALLKVILLIGISLLALTGALAAACFVKVFGMTFLAIPRSPAAAQTKEVPVSMLAGPAFLTLCLIIPGIFPGQILGLLGLSVALPNMMIINILLILTAVLIFLASSIRSPGIRTTGTWDCGFSGLSGKTEYSDTGFSQPIMMIFKSIYRTDLSIEKEYWDQKNCFVRSGTADIRLIRFFEEYLYSPAGRAVEFLSRKVSGLQTGDLDTYLLYVFITILILILYIGWSA